MLWKLFVCWTWHVRIVRREFEQYKNIEKRKTKERKKSIRKWTILKALPPIVSALCISHPQRSIQCVCMLRLKQKSSNNSSAKVFLLLFSLFNYPRFKRTNEKLFKWKNSHTQRVDALLSIERICCFPK